MAVLFLDGFDKYGPAGQTTPTVASLLTAGEWTAAFGNTPTFIIVSGLSAGGQGLNITAGGSIGAGINKTLPANYSRIIGGIRLASPLASAASIEFRDGATPQFSITLNTIGNISIRSGTGFGSTLGTAIATAGSVSANSTHYLEWDVTIGAAGAYQVWLDGVSVLSGTGNTRAGTANNYVNVVAIGASGTAGGLIVFDDLYLFDSTGSTCNAPLLNNPIVETALPNADTQKQWTPGGTIIGNDNSATATTNAPGANQLFLRQFTAPANMTLNSMSCVPGATSGAAKFRPVIYGPPGAIGGHRYWRVNILGGGGVSPIVAEFQFRTTAGTPLLFSGGTTSANSGTAASAADNNPGTVWSGSTYPTWWQYDYGAGNTPTIAEITVQNNSGNSNSPGNFDVQYSDDATTWFTVANASMTWSAGNQVNTFTFSARPTVPGSPGSALIAQGNEVIGTTTGATLTAAFPTPPTLTAGTAYAIGFITDTSIVLQQQDNATAGLRVANTYTAGAPAVLPTPTTAQANWKVWGNCTGANFNYTSLINNPAIDDIAFVSDSTPGHEDLYGFPALSSNPASISCVAYKARIKRSDAGTRTVEVRCLSGAADSAGTLAAATPGSSFNWLDTHFPLDPNTGLAWTGTGVNAASGGVKVAS